MEESNKIGSVLDGKYDEHYGEEEVQLNKLVVQRSFENGESSQAKEEIVFTSYSIPKKAASLAPLSHPASTDAKVLPSTYNPESFKCPYCTCAKAWFPTKFSRIPTFLKPQKLKTDYEKVMETYKTKQANTANEFEKEKIEYTMIMEADNKQVYRRDEGETNKAKFELTNDDFGDENRELRGFCQMSTSEVNDGPGEESGQAKGSNEKGCSDKSASEVNDGPGEESGQANGNNEKGCSDKSASEVNDRPGEESGQELDDE